MKNKTKEDFGQTVAFTLQALEELKVQGFRYVRVDAFARDKRPDHIGTNYFVLMPVKDLSNETGTKGVYEPIDSPILRDWANFSEEGIKVLVTTG